MHVYSYAPTNQAEKDKSIELNITSRAVGILRDFNARVGSREDVSDVSGNMHGPHCYRELNDAGQELLVFLSIKLMKLLSVTHGL